MEAEVMHWPTTVEEWGGFLLRSGLTPQAGVLALALAYYSEQLLGRSLVITSGYRTEKQQNALSLAYKAGKSGIFKPAQKSLHLKGMAFDCVYSDGSPPDSQLAAIAKQLGLRWGGTFSAVDPVHFDLLATT